MIRLATPDDLDAIESIYLAILDREEETGRHYTNWDRNLYPTRAYAAEVLKAGTMYVDVVNGQVISCVNLNHVQPPEYANIPWTIPAKGKEVLVIHTLCVHPAASGRHSGRRFVSFAEGFGKGLGCKVIRLDTYEGNEPALAFYPKLGYRYAGITRFHFQNVIWENLKCFEKAL